MPNQNSKITVKLDSLVDIIEELLKDGFSINEISMKLGYGYSAVYNCVRRNGLKNYVSVKNIGKGRRYDDYIEDYNNNHILTKELLYDMYIVKKLNLKEIADMYGVSPSGVLYRIRKYGIKTRTISEASKLMYENNPGLREVHRRNANNGITGIFKKGNMYNNTLIERIFEKYCVDNGLLYKRQFQLYDGGHRYDFLIGDNIIVELDGIYWHSTNLQVEKDEMFTKEAEDQGFLVLRFTDVQIKTTNGGCFDDVKRYV